MKNIVFTTDFILNEFYLFYLLQRNSISPAEREKYSRPRSTPDPQHHDHMHLKKMKKEQDKDIGHVRIYNIYYIVKIYLLSLILELMSLAKRW